MVKTITLNYIKKHLGLSLFLLVTIIGSILASLLPPLLLKQIVDVYLVSKTTDGLLMIAVYYLLVFVLISIFDILTNISLSLISGGILYETRKTMNKNLHKLSTNALNSKTPAEIESYFSNDVNSINDFIINGVVSLIINLFKIIGIVISIFILSSYFGYISLGCVLVVSLIVSFTLRRMYKAEFENKKLIASVNSIVLETLTNIKSIKVFNVKQYIIGKYDKILKSHYKNKQTINFFDSILSPVLLILEHTVIILVIVLFGVKGSLLGLSIGTLAGLISYLNNLFDPIIEFGKQIQTVQYSISGIKRVDEYFLLEQDVSSDNKIYMNKSYICGENLSFSYDGKKEVFNNFNFNINKGEKIMLTGASGAGKTTLIKIIFGLLKPTVGNVYVNSKISFKNQNNLFGVLFQEPFFSNETVRNEITLGELYSNEEIYNVLHLLDLDKKFDNLDDVLDDTLLSSGERALFNLGRIILRNDPIIILDEINSHIDKITYKKIINIVNEKFRDNTIISINHYGELLENVRIIEVNDPILGLI